MKTWLLLLISIPFLSFSQEYVKRSGDFQGNGGSTEKIKLNVLLNDIYKIVKENASDFSEINLEQFQLAISETEIEFKRGPLFLNGKRVDAINYPDEKRIVFDRTKWIVSQKELSYLVALIVHEFLGIMYIEDKNYYVSSRVLGYWQDRNPRWPWQWQCWANCARAYVNGSDDSLRVKNPIVENLTQVYGEGMNALEAFQNMVAECMLFANSEKAFILRTKAFTSADDWFQYGSIGTNPVEACREY